MDVSPPDSETFVTLDTGRPIWERFFTVAPLVVIGTREEQKYNLAPKHMVAPLGWENHFGFVCTPSHATYHNAKQAGAFTVSFPRPSQLVLASLSAASRDDRSGHKSSLETLPTIAAKVVDGVFLANAYLLLECELERVADGFGDNSLLAGAVVAAHVHRGALRRSEVDDQHVLRETPLLVYVSPGRYAVVEDTNAFPFPAGFEK